MQKGMGHFFGSSVITRVGNYIRPIPHCFKIWNGIGIGGDVRRCLGGDSPTGTDECAGDVAADAVASVVQTDDPAGSIQEKG